MHIGTHKTGTTSIQAFLAENRDRLTAMGIFVPRSAGEDVDGFAAHHAMVSQLLGAAKTEDGAGGLDAVCEELAKSDAPMSCVSSEDISLLYARPELLIRLRDAIVGAGYLPKIVVYVRPQASYAVAIYAANVLSGYRLPFTTYLTDVFKHGCYRWDGGSGPPFDYGVLLDAFAAVFGRDAVCVRVFRSDARDSALLLSFMHVLRPQLRDLGDFIIPAKRANRTLTFSAVLRLLAVENSIDQHVRFAPLTLAELMRFRARFRTSNRLLQMRYGITLPCFELPDVLRALPVRRTLRITLELQRARKLFRQVARADAGRAAEPAA